MRFVIIVAAAAAASGCYYYRPLTRTPAPEMALSVTLTDSGTDRLWRYLGPDVETLRGRLLFSDDSTYTLSVTAVDLRHGTTLGWNREHVAVRRDLVAGLSERRFSLGRTALTSSLSAAAFLLTLKAFDVLGSGSPSGGGGGRPR